MLKDPKLEGQRPLPDSIKTVANYLNSYCPEFIFVICGNGEKYQDLKLMFKKLKNVIIEFIH